jgi:hypothetical protein
LSVYHELHRLGRESCRRENSEQEQCCETGCCLVDQDYASYDVAWGPETNCMVGALRRNSPILSVLSFRTWLASRPDE